MGAAQNNVHIQRDEQLLPVVLLVGTPLATERIGKLTKEVFTWHNPVVAAWPA
jgi:hypothetical protein